MVGYGSFAGGDDGEYKGVGFVEISEIFPTPDALSLEQNYLKEFTNEST